MTTKILCKVTIAVITLTFTGVTAQAQITAGDKDPMTLYWSQTDSSQIKNNLIGSWVLEEHPSNKITFTRDNELKRYYKEELRSTKSFMIGSICDDEPPSSGYFLITTSSAGVKTCDYIDQVPEIDGKGRLVLITTGQGKIIIFKRV